MKTKALLDIEHKMSETDESSFRYQVLEAARYFKTNWLELGRHLYNVKKDKLFKTWGFNDFYIYCQTEIGIKRQTAFKLLNSYYFMSKEEPDFLDKSSLSSKKPSSIPHYEAIDILRKAKNNKELPETDYNKLKGDVFESVYEPREVGKQFRSMLWAAKSVDPESERKNRRLVTIRRFISTFKVITKEAEILKIIPGKLISDAEKIILSIENSLDTQK